MYKYDVIIIFIGFFCLIENCVDFINVLKCFYEYFNLGGWLIVDIMFLYKWKIGEIYILIFFLLSGDGIILENKLIEIDWLN